MNARNNSDKLCNTSCSNNFNAIHNVEDITGSGTISEPVSLDEMKAYLRLEGFHESAAIPAEDFDFDDDLILAMITEGRMWCEKFTGIHLVSKSLQVTLTNGVGMMPIPGPVTGTISWKDDDGNSITAGRLIGSLFPKIESETCERQVLEYEAGYGTDVPTWAQNAIKAYVAWAFEHRGDEADLKGSPERAAAICRPYIRTKSFA